MASIDDEQHFREMMARESEYERYDRSRKADSLEPTGQDDEDKTTRYWSALCMIARHACHASDKTRPDWHCGECASCVAKEAIGQE